MSVQSVYIALFGRPADPGGLAYWNSVTKNGADLSEMLRVLPSLPEYTSRFEGMTNDQVITNIYENLFGRKPDAEGLAFFTNALSSGTQSIATIAVNILDGAQNDDQANIQAKEAAANLFTESLDTPEEIAAYNGEIAARGAQAFLDNVDADHPATPESVNKAIDAVEAGDPNGGQEPDDDDDEEPGPVDPGPTNAVGSVTIAGDAEVGDTLTATVADGNGITGTITYTWYADDEVIAGATTNTLDVAASFFGREITVSANYQDGAGFSENVSASAGEVDTDAPGDVLLYLAGDFISYSTIQAAIDAAKLAGTAATIVVRDKGSPYVEQLKIDGISGLTIVGEDGATIQSPASGLVNNHAGIGTKDRASVVSVTNSSEIVLRNLVVDGDHKANIIPTPGGDFHGVFFGNSSGTIEGLSVIDVGDPRENDHVSGMQRGNAIYVLSTDPTTKQVEIKDNIVTGHQKNGITVAGTGIVADIIDNDITGDGLLSHSGAQAQNGIQVSGGAKAIVTENTIEGIGRQSTDGWSASNILLYEAGAGTSVFGNVIVGAGGNSTLGVASVDGTASSSTGIGSNTISGVVEHIYVYGNAATDTMLINGTANYDYIHGGKGDDFINAFGGNDVIIGDRGNDMLFGGSGNDVIWGDNPADTGRDPSFYGDDTINAGGGTNVIVLGTKSQDIKLGGQDTVRVVADDNAFNVIFNFNFGPITRYDNIDTRAVGVTSDQPGADLTFDILSVNNASNLDFKIRIGQDNSLYENGVKVIDSSATFANNSTTLSGETIYVGNSNDFEIMVEFEGGAAVVFANAMSRWEKAALLKAMDFDGVPGQSATTDWGSWDGTTAPDANAVNADLALMLGIDPTTGLVQLGTDHANALIGILQAQGNLQVDPIL